MKTNLKTEFTTCFSQTCHANARIHQRGVSSDVMTLALTYGEERPAGSGCTSIYIDRSALRDIKEAIGYKAFARIEAQLNGLYIIVAGDRVVTVARAQ